MGSEITDAISRALLTDTGDPARGAHALAELIVASPGTLGLLGLLLGVVAGAPVLALLLIYIVRVAVPSS